MRTSRHSLKAATAIGMIASAGAVAAQDAVDPASCVGQVPEVRVIFQPKPFFGPLEANKAECEERWQTNLELVSIAADRLGRLVGPCLPQLDYLIVNDFEIGALAGIPDPAADPERLTAAARSVVARRATRLVAEHYPGGAVLVTRDGAPLFVPSLEWPDDWVVGANGAGDAFAAGLPYGLHHDREPERAARLAHAVAATSLHSPGMTHTILSLEECLALAGRFGWRQPS